MWDVYYTLHCAGFTWECDSTTETLKDTGADQSPGENKKNKNKEIFRRSSPMTYVSKYWAEKGANHIHQDCHQENPLP